MWFHKITGVENKVPGRIFEPKNDEANEHFRV
jgi:hypothetical protein